jgi:hypothetical protein
LRSRRRRAQALNLLRKLPLLSLELRDALRLELEHLLLA